MIVKSYSELIKNQNLFDLVPYTAIKLDYESECNELFMILSQILNSDQYRVINHKELIGNCYVLDFPKNTFDSQQYLLNNGYNIISLSKFKNILLYDEIFKK